MPPPRRDFTRLQGQLQDWFRTKFPDWGSVRVDNLRGPAETGYSSDTVVFEVFPDPASGRQPKTLVAKLHPEGVTVFPEYDLERQYRLLEALQALSTAPVPSVFSLELDPRFVGGVFYVMDFVSGRVPPDNPPYHTSGWLLDLDPGSRRQLWEEGIAAMARVHRTRCTEAIRGLFPQPKPGSSFLDQQLEDYRKFIDWGLDRSRYPLLSRAEEWLYRHQPREEQVALCWGDARFGNQIFRDGRCVALLDWEMARLGDPVQDLAWWWAIDRCFAEGLGVPRLDGLPTREATIRLWETQSTFSAKEFDYYEILALYKFTAIMARVVRQLCFYEVLPADTTMDRDNLASAVLERELDRRGG
jgi:aminoglycoside phosphotransferase (APT) family kinase protein